MFYHFASRWAWRYVVFKLMSPTPTVISKMYHICALFRTYPEVTAYIQVLSIELDLRCKCSLQIHQVGEALLAIAPLFHIWSNGKQCLANLVYLWAACTPGVELDRQHSNIPATSGHV